MAKYTNPLDEFTSHSVQYVVLACRSTEDLRGFTNDSPSGQTESLQAINNCKALGSEVKLAGKPGSVFLMLDTRRFAQFSISNFTLDTLVAGFAVPGSSSPHSTAITMSFTIIDSTGISFANFLQYMTEKQLQVSFTGMTLLVRVLFIGHRLDGSTATVQSVTIPAIFNTIQVDLSDTKGIYNCTLFPLTGMPSNAGYNAKWTSIGTASSYFTGQNVNTLGAVVDSFEAELNRLSIARFIDLNSKVQNAGQKTKAVNDFGRPVQYMITLPKEWQTFTFSGPTQGNATETNFAQLVKDQEVIRAAATAKEAQQKAQQNSTSAAKDSFVSVNSNLTITEVLDIIFSQTLEVAKLGNFTKKQDQNGNLKFYKHIITVTSDDSSFLVHADVVEYFVPNVMLNQKPGASTTERDQLLFNTEKTAQAGVVKKVPKNFIEFDYIFSGVNIDVMSLDLKIENLNWLLMQGMKLGAGAINDSTIDGQKQTDGEGVSDDTRQLLGMGRKDPVLMPQRTKNENTNFPGLAANAKSTNDASPQELAQQYTQNLSAFYNAGPINAKLELRGNPEIMASMTLGTIPAHRQAITITSSGGVTSTANPAAKQKYREEFERDILKLAPNSPIPRGPINAALLSGPSYLMSPVFIKVNVYGPNVDFMNNELIAGQNFSTQLFYDNFYWLNKISSKIDGAKFTQELDLHSYSIYGYSALTAKGATNSATKKT